MADKSDPTSELEVQKLQSYYSFLTPSELIGKYATTSVKNSSTSSENDRVTGVIMEALFNTSFKGLYSLSDLVDVFDTQLNSNASVSDALIEEFHRLISVRADGLKLSGDKVDRASLAKLFGVADTETSVLNTDFKIGYVLCNSPRISLGVRDVHSVAAFMNAVPTVELARAIPFLSINFKTSRDAVTEQGKYLNAPTILRFLNGSAQVDQNSVDSEMVLATANPDGKTSGFEHMGMEIFTSPISMTPFSIESNPALRTTRINDPFRPIMSIDSMTIEVIPTIGVYQYKTANLNITLHDKSRLSEVSDLVRPEAFGGGAGKAGIEITYGWSHPDTITTGNVYGVLLNRMRVTEVFSIINSKFSFTPEGQVKISLSLATKGAYDMHRAKILDFDITSEAQQLQKLTEKIKTLRDQANLRATSDIMKEVRVFQVLDVAEAGERPELKDFSKKLDEALKTLQNTGSKDGKGKESNARKVAKELADILDELYKKKDGSGHADGLLGKIDRTVQDNIFARFDYLSKTEDPFLTPLEKRKNGPKYPWDEDIEKFNKEKIGPGNLKKNFLVSLGSLLMTFIGLPMMAAKNVSEVQFVFHTFNNFAGRAGGQNVSLFPVEFEYFRDIFQKLARQRRDPNYTLEEFTRIISDHIINNPRSVGYGMRSLYQVSNDKDDASALPKIELAKNVKGEDVANQMTRILEGKGGTFKFPILESFIETLPRRRPKGTDELPENDASYNIMRIHFYDKQATPYEPVFDLLAGARGDHTNQNIDELKPSLDRGPDNPPPQTQAVMAAFSAYVATVNSKATVDEKKKVPIDGALKERGARAAFKAGGNIIVPGGADSMRDFIRETVPTITYGSSLSAVKQADVATLQDAMQQAIFMKNSARGNPTQPNGSDIGGLPVTVLPTTINLTTFGCPLLALMQQFFVDFSTGTSVDNIYFVTGLSHDIQQGKFETKIKMTPGEAYGKFKPIKESLAQISRLLKLDSADNK